MKENALSIANYFIRKSLKDGYPIRQLKLMKLVYISHGYMLALLDRTALDPNLNRVEAWKYGPVIPSVYYAFNHYKGQPITETAKELSIKDDEAHYVEPKAIDKKESEVCDFVWSKYREMTDSELVTLLHGKGTPWGKVYEKGKNNLIPDVLTYYYYKSLVHRLTIVAKEKRKQNEYA